jgi:polyprenyl-phospho-N-acetylgalactosaminyl synthase
MPDSFPVSVVIPAFNESKSIGRVVSSLRSQGYSVVVVDDCSTDETAQVAQQHGAIVLRHVLNLGQGGALQTGIAYCVRSGASYICTFDADGQHRAEDVRTLWERLDSGRFDIVLGSRFLGEAHGISLSRRLLLKLAIRFTRMHSGLKLTDAHNGLRMMTGEVAARLRLSQLRMAHASEIIDEISRLNLNYAEAPVTIVYTDYSKAKGQSTLGSIRILIDLAIGRFLR